MGGRAAGGDDRGGRGGVAVRVLMQELVGVGVCLAIGGWCGR